MIRIGVAIVAVLGLAACGGGSRYSSSNAAAYGGGYAAVPVVPFASGPIQKACEADGRKEASRTRCGCVQAVADQSLSARDQRRGAKMFRDPHQLQEIRQSDNANNERFWKAWKEFGQNAAAVCAQT
ncbi:hypothetical protein BOO69_14835 [Sulfitobacter alexandrii]|uniref:Arginine transporter n=1 Tax=Sulfitobacter alexandrii TaxID=1917485 RepID=A0A1J0WK44_9RHOB|nr:hypothetical protein [Sulfitobacter alexandrii]APE44544.1 hypothetical protein BOO69_14835 [Sulfitobacter alexandrii]